MDQIAQRVLRFDRFALDLTRGCVRAADRGIDLRPKVFDVLRYLAENAGRLVPKQELIEAVWPNVFVSDDSLSQCIRELREKLGDREHNLIKTVPRRGYLLDAAVTTSLGADVSLGLAPISVEPTRIGSSDLTGPRPARFAWAAAVLVLACAAVTAAYWLWPSPIPSQAAQTAGGGGQPGRSFKDCDVCPEMIALPAGEFMMGSPEDELGRAQVEGLPRRVTIAKPFAIGRFEITVGEFTAFVEETGSPVSSLCRLIDPAAQRGRAGGNSVVWGAPEGTFREQRGYDITGSHPAGCISWHEADAYVTWLARRTGKPYRLPSEAEWEYAARAGTTTSFSFGQDETELCAYGRFADLSSPFLFRGTCRSKTEAPGPLPVGSLKPNPWGLFDMHGNVWEWTLDCWMPNAREIPTDGSAATRPGKCEIGAIRGGSWAAAFPRLRSAFRYGLLATRRDQNVGFRVVLPLVQ